MSEAQVTNYERDEKLAEFKEALRQFQDACEKAGYERARCHYEKLESSARLSDVQVSQQEPARKNVVRLHTEARAEAEDWEATFDLYSRASERAIALWQEAHPDRSDVWPDTAELIMWLIEKLDEAGGGGG